LTTFSYQGREVPAGLELLYEGARESVYKRINRIAKEARFAETVALASAKELPDLAADVKLSIEQDALTNPAEKTLAKAWLLNTLKDTKATDSEKKRYLADYILSGHRSD
jgi:hypothetical protein